MYPSVSILPGPIEGSLLSLQQEHRSEDVWIRDSISIIPLKGRQAIRHYLPQDERVIYYVRRAGFYGIHRLVSTFEMEMSLVTALVERWRPETHTFHLSVGEATITLEDVAVLLGLRVDGEPVTGTAAHDWPEVVQELLGAVPPKEDLVGSSLRIRWLREHFANLPADADEDTVKCYARAYILQLMGGILFGDTTGKNVQLLFLPLLADFEEASTYSWGSATLAHMYRHLCKAAHRGKTDIAGPLILIQLWAWERIPIGRPTCTRVPSDMDPRIARNIARRKASREARDLVGNEKPAFGSQFIPGDDSLARRWIHCSYSYEHSSRPIEYYRDILDRQLGNEFIWLPYPSDVLQRLPEICRSGAHIYMTEAPLICFDIVEWHRPGRVMRQFGFPPAIPHDCDYDKQVHKVDRRGKLDYNWAEYHDRFINLWNERSSLIVIPQPFRTHGHEAIRQYMNWYISVTRRFISPPTSNPTGYYQPTTPNLFMLGQYAANVGHYGRKTANTTQQHQRSQDLEGLSQNVNTFCNYLSTESTNILDRAAVDPFYLLRGPSSYIMPTPEVPRSSHQSPSFSTPPLSMSPSGYSPSAYTPLGTPLQPNIFASPPLPHYAQYRDPILDLGEQHVSDPRALSPIIEDASTSRGERGRRKGKRKTT